MSAGAILITPKDKAERKLLEELIQRMGLRGTTLEKDELEDLGLTLLLRKVDRTKKVSRDRIMRQLKG